MEIQFPSLKHSITQLNIANSKLLDIDYCDVFERYYAVGNTGLTLYFEDEIQNYNALKTSTTNDLTVIKFNSSGYKARIGGVNAFHHMTTSGNFIDTYETPNETSKDLLYGTFRMYTVNDNYSSFNYTNKTTYSNHDYGTLNGNTIKYYDGFHFIGTDHGIFKSNSDKTIIEWQPSSLKQHINSFWKTYGENPIYACGPDGVILKNEIEPLLKETKPYIKIEYNGGCISTYTKNVEATIGNSSKCNWYINNILTSNDCDDFKHKFDTLGEYIIKLIVDFNDITTETTKTIHIVNPPLIDKPISVLDSILCKEETTEITINDSEPNVLYVLRKENSAINYGTSEIGNGGLVKISSELINETGMFYIEAQNTNATSCGKSFTDTFEIIVEQTKANFHVDLINASINENISLHNLSEEAEKFKWNYNNANIGSGIEENPIVSFVKNGVHEIKLQATSAHNCEDETSLNSPNIYKEPSSDQECWSYINTIEHPNYTGSYIPEISHITQVTDGYLTGGYYRNGKFASNHGVPLNINNNEGAYLTKHDSKGVLKWWIHSQSTIDYFRERSLATASVQDHEVNIYLALNTINCDFYDNSGKELKNLNGGKIFISSYSFDVVINDVFTLEDNADKSSCTTTSYYGFIVNENGYYISTNPEISAGTTNGRINYYNNSCAEKYSTEETLSSHEYNLQELQLYPNPTSNNITLKTNEIASTLEVKIYNPIGQEIFRNTYKNTNEVSIEIPNINGLYILELSIDQKEKIIKKIIKL